MSSNNNANIVLILPQCRMVGARANIGYSPFHISLTCNLQLQASHMIGSTTTLSFEPLVGSVLDVDTRWCETQPTKYTSFCIIRLT
jgi:hypothetical protein